ncbi:MAG: NAD(P)-dependent oxidoreductase [Galactobacter sp.]
MSPHLAAPRVAVHGDVLDFMTQALQAGGAELVGLDESPQILALDHGNDATQLVDILDKTPSIEWVQLPSAGIDKYLDALAAYPDKIWTSAKGAYAEPVAEHALMLTLGVARLIRQRAQATSWQEMGGISLFDAHAVVVGAGGVGLEIVRLLKTFRCSVDVVRRTDAPAPGADRTFSAEHLDELLPQADVVVLAAALTGQTTHLIGEAQLASMKQDAILVNIARGPMVDCEALAASLKSGHLYGAGLDVTEPEPLTEGHPLWEEPRCLITPHTADTLPMIRALLGQRFAANLSHWRADEDLDGVVDPVQGY